MNIAHYCVLIENYPAFLHGFIEIQAKKKYSRLDRMMDYGVFVFNSRNQCFRLISLFSAMPWEWFMTSGDFRNGRNNHVSDEQKHQDTEHEDREDFYEMRRRMHNLRDRDFRTNNKSGCVMQLVAIPFIVTVLLLISLAL